MRSRTLIVGLAPVVLASSIAVAVAAKKPNPIGPFTVHFAGCPILHDIEGGCLTVKSKGSTYEINAIRSDFDPAKHLGIAGTGLWYPATGTTCMMGKPLSHIKWNYTRQKCLGG